MEKSGTLLRLSDPLTLRTVFVINLDRQSPVTDQNSARVMIIIKITISSVDTADILRTQTNRDHPGERTMPNDSVASYR